MERLGANEQPVGTHLPPTDASARFIVSPEESAEALRLRARAVGCYGRERLKFEWNKNPWIEGRSVDDRWEVTVLSDRILVWFPMSAGVFSGLKEKPGRATGGAVRFNDIDEIHRDGNYDLRAPDTVVADTAVGLILQTHIDQIPSSGPYILTLWSSNKYSSSGYCLELDFPDVETSKAFCATLARGLVATWMHEAEVGAQSLAKYEHDQNTWEWHDHHEAWAQAAALDVNKVEAEVAKLTSIDWTDPNGTLSVSMMAAGCPVH